MQCWEFWKPVYVCMFRTYVEIVDAWACCSREGEYRPSRSFSFISWYPHGVSSVAYAAAHSALIVGGASQQPNDAAAAAGLTVWRVLSDTPYYKLISDTDTTAVSSLIYYGAVLPRRRPHHVSIVSVCPSVRLSVPCRHLQGKRKNLRIPNMVGRVPGTPVPRGPISRSRPKGSKVKVTATNCVVKFTISMFIVYCLHRV